MRDKQHSCNVRYIQGATTLVSDQTSSFEKLIKTLFINDVGVMGPLAQEANQHLDPGLHVSSGLYIKSLLQVREFLCGLAMWIGEGIIDEADAAQRQHLLRDIGSVFTVACN